jgi:ABC-2 type transport system ATP-binding protein
VVALVGLEDKAGERIGRLSGGQRRRVDVALGIVGRPELLFLDEPTTGFDPEARHHFWDTVRRLGDEGTTMVLTTHYLEEAEALADRVGVIAGGHLVAEGAPEELGGRDRSAATVAWDEPGGGRHEVETEEPTALVQQLAARSGGEVPGLTVRRPTLEDIYLRLIASPALEPAARHVEDPSAAAGSGRGR